MTTVRTRWAPHARGTAWALALATVLLATGCATVAPTDPGAATPTPAAVALQPAVQLPPQLPEQPSGASPEAAASALPQVIGVEAALPPLAADPHYIAPPPFPRGRLDPGQDAERSDLWPRVRDGFGMPELDNDLVRKWEQWYARDPAYVQRMVQRGGRYLFHILEEVQRRNLPTELALLPFIESAFNPQAESRARASGMWQFMPGTGKDFELRQNLFRDDRRDVLASTRAALDYLQRLNTMFDGDWHLALAAYNWGQGNVLKALERNRRAGVPADYENLRMPQETREYVPKLQAVKNIVLRPDAYGLALPLVENHPFFLTVSIDRDIDVALAARLAGMPLEEFQQLNPQMNKPVILAAGTPQVLLPYDAANRFLRQLAAHRGALASWTAWVAPKTLKPAEVAHLTGMNEDQLREVNRIPPRMLVKIGSTLLVPRAAHSMADVAEHIADNGALALAPEARPVRTVQLKAGRNGETVASVARRYKLSPAQVAQWNGVPAQGRFKPGQAIVLKLPVAATVRSARPAPPRTKAPMTKPTSRARHIAPR